ncbi:hypothetical protein GGR54DRAFT_623510 [Hypoxylon sp. NC1633]|nr:hypothetical protein GGR54DRAFT_623510 [Hypoxylon sp. NC1633]
MKCQAPNIAVSAGVLASSIIGTALAATSGQFNVLSMNVAGLPAFLNNNEVPGDKATNSELIGSKFAQYDYDIIHVQEVGRPVSSSLQTSPLYL